MDNLTKHFRIRKTCLEMLNDRQYLIGQVRHTVMRMMLPCLSSSLPLHLHLERNREISKLLLFASRMSSTCLRRPSETALEMTRGKTTSQSSPLSRTIHRAGEPPYNDRNPALCPNEKPQ